MLEHFESARWTAAALFAAPGLITGLFNLRNWITNDESFYRKTGRRRSMFFGITGISFALACDRQNRDTLDTGWKIRSAYRGTAGVSRRGLSRPCRSH